MRRFESLAIASEDDELRRRGCEGLEDLGRAKVVARLPAKRVSDLTPIASESKSNSPT